MSRIRSVKPSIHTDFKTGTLSDLAFRFFIGLTNISDDYGVSKFNIYEYKALIFPYKLETPENLVNPLIFEELEPKGLIIIFEIFDGEKKEKYLFIKNFLKHQNVNRPNDPILIGWQKNDTPNTYLKRLNSVSDQLSISEHSVNDQCNINDTSLPEGKGKERKGIYRSNQDIFTSGAMPSQAIAQKEETYPQIYELAVISFPLNDKSEYSITQNKIDEWSSLYPAVDILSQLRNAKAWCINNPQRRKTKNGILRFLNTWLSKEQDKGSNIVKLNGGKIYEKRERAIESLAQKVARQQSEYRNSQQSKSIL